MSIREQEAEQLNSIIQEDIRNEIDPNEVSESDSEYSPIKKKQKKINTKKKVSKQQKNGIEKEIRMPKRGPKPFDGSRPSKEKYTCPVTDCNARYRGDHVGNHFQKNANLLALDEVLYAASECQSTLQEKSSAEKLEEHLKSLLAGSPESEKLHTLHLLHHGHTSQQLPNYNSVTFKCQQKKNTNLSLPNAFQKSEFSILPKKGKLSDKCDNFEHKSKKSKVTDNSEEIVEETLFVETFQHDSFDEKNCFESEIMNKNPWLVESIQDFYFLKCPECEYDTKEEYSFQDHAVENHPLSFVFFMKSEPANIDNVLDVSILPKEQVHERKKRKPCPYCDHTSANSSNLRKHIAAFHEGENISLREKFPPNPLIMKSEPVTIENIQDASMLPEDIDIFENSLEIKSEYHEDNYSEPIENETVSKKEENDILKKDLLNVTAENVQKISKLNPKSGILKTKRVFKTKPGPKSTGRPSKEKYKCPVKDCNSIVRGDDIGKHFKTKANLLVLDTATEYKSTLEKSLTSAKGQLISKCPFGIIVWTKIPTKLFLDFCPEIFCSFLGDSWKLFGLPGDLVIIS